VTAPASKPVFKPFTHEHRAILAQLFALGVVVEIKALRTYVRGRNTYPIRETLRALGFSWHASSRVWSAPGRLDIDLLPVLLKAHRDHERASEKPRPHVMSHSASMEMVERISRGLPARAS
jgi:hypothetical protein